MQVLRKVISKINQSNQQQILSKDTHSKKCIQSAKEYIKQKKSKLKTINSQKKIILNIKKKSKTKEKQQNNLQKDSKQKIKTKNNNSKSKILKSKLTLSKQKINKSRSKSRNNILNRQTKQSLRIGQSVKSELLKKSKQSQSKKSFRKLVQNQIRQNKCHNQISNKSTKSHINTNLLIQQKQDQIPKIYLNNQKITNLESKITGSRSKQVDPLKSNLINSQKTKSNILICQKELSDQSFKLFQNNQVNNSRDISNLPENTFEIQYFGKQNYKSSKDLINSLPNSNRSRISSYQTELGKKSKRIICALCSAQFKTNETIKILNYDEINEEEQIKQICSICNSKLI